MALETVVDSKGIYFIAFTCHDWLPLIDFADAYHEVYKFFNVIKKEGNDIVGYVIMPNHLHFLVHYTNTSKKLNMNRISINPVYFTSKGNIDIVK